VHQCDAAEKEAEEAVTLDAGDQARADAHREPKRQKDFHLDAPHARNAISPRLPVDR
jgi:hypothetical protein